MSDGLFATVVTVAIALLTAAMIGGGLAVRNAQCHARFQDSELEARWSFMGGCQVKVPGHGWLPADNYRVL